MYALQPNTILDKGKYRILRVIEEGGLEITYLAAYNDEFKSCIKYNIECNKVVIKEFFVKDLCGRSRRTNDVIFTANDVRADFNQMRNTFLLDANKNMDVIDTFKENGTAYYVKKYIENEEFDTFGNQTQIKPKDDKSTKEDFNSSLSGKERKGRFFTTKNKKQIAKFGAIALLVIFVMLCWVGQDDDELDDDYYTSQSTDSNDISRNIKSDDGGDVTVDSVNAFEKNVTKVVMSDDVSFVVKADSIVTLGNKFRLTYTLNNAESDNLQLPIESMPSDLTIAHGPYVSTGKSISIKDGVEHRSSSVTYGYMLVPKKEGLITIPSAKAVLNDGKILQSNTLEINVVKGD